MRRTIRAVVDCLASLGLLVMLVSATPLVPWWAERLGRPWTEPQGDTLIIIGGSILGNGMVGENSYWRAIYGAMAFGGGGFREVVVSGGGEPKPIAISIADYLVSQGVPRNRIRLETESRTTRENAVRTAALLAREDGRKVLLTSDYHMYRAARAFRKAGVHVLPRPFPDGMKRGASWQGRWPAFLDLVVESVKILYYWARGWI